MKITRDVIIDLLPVYAAGEASADTKVLVEEYVKQDASLGALLRGLQAADRDVDTAIEPPARLEREALNRTRGLIRRRSWTLALATFFTLLPVSFRFGSGGITFFFLGDSSALLIWAGAIVLWAFYLKQSRQLSGSGLSG